MADVTNELTDVKIDIGTGFAIIDPVTNDAEIIRGNDVVLQDAAIRLRTQLGTQKRQELDNFGWNFIGRLKQKKTESNQQDAVAGVSRVILEDSRIDDTEVDIVSEPLKNELTISANLKVGDVTLPLTVTI